MTEVLSPVGSIKAFYAAINAGCDAVYLAGEAYGARKAIDKFSVSEIKDIIKLAHKYNVKVYVTVNTLIFDDEIEELLKYTAELYLGNVDAFLIQDLGLLNIFSKRYKDLELHISTQANIKTLEEVKFFESIPNVKRIVLARETDFDTIKKIKENTSLEIEVFVHGAICMGYSGNCLFSSLLFSRSGNRGECAQPCRLKYSLVEDDKVIDSEKYLLSPKELNTINYVDKLIEIGIDSLKIEGRIKSPEYVYCTTKLYKEKVLNPKRLVKDIEIENLKRLYNRDFTKGYVFNEDSNDLVNTYRPNHQGIIIGKVLSSTNKTITISINKPLSRLDGIRIIDDNNEDIGITVDKIYKNNKEIEYAKDGIVVIEAYKIKKGISNGSKVAVTYSKELSDSISLNFDKINRKSKELNLRFTAKISEFPSLENISTNTVITGDMITSLSEKRPITKDIIINQLSRLENSEYYINDIVIDIDDDIFLPLGLINNMRRSLLLELSKEEPSNRTINKNYSFDNRIVKETSALRIKCETIDQFSTAYSLGFKSFIVSSLALYHGLKNKYSDIEIELALPRIINDYDKNIDADSVLVDEVGSIYKYNIKMAINCYLNVTNIYSANLLFNKKCINRVALSIEMSENRILSFINRYYNTFKSKPNVEVIIYDRSDLMITKYCAIRAHKNYKEKCGLCKTHRYYLKDRTGEMMPVIGTSTCGNRILNPKITCLFKYKKELKESGIENFRINFTIESSEEVKEVLLSYINNEPLSGNKYTYGRYLK